MVELSCLTGPPALMILIYCARDLDTTISNPRDPVETRVHELITRAGDTYSFQRVCRAGCYAAHVPHALLVFAASIWKRVPEIGQVALTRDDLALLELVERHEDGVERIDGQPVE